MLTVVQSHSSNPRVVFAPSRDDKSKIIQLVCSANFLQRLDYKSQKHKIGEYYGLVRGALVQDFAVAPSIQLPRGLRDATSLWQGLKRPATDHIYTYVTNPPCTFSVTSRVDANLVQEPKPRNGNAVFVVYVEFTTDFNKFNMPLPQGQGPFSGVVLRWEWVVCDPLDRDLPLDSDDRYHRRVW